MDTPGLHILLVSNLPVGRVRTSAAVSLTQRCGPNAVLFLLVSGTAVTVAPAAPDADIAFDLAGGGRAVPTAAGNSSSSGPAFRVWYPLGAVGHLGNAAAAPLPVETQGRQRVLAHGQGMPVAAAMRVPIRGGEEGGPLLGWYLVSPRTPRATLAEARQVVDRPPPSPPKWAEDEEDEDEEREEQDPDIEMQDAEEQEMGETSRERPGHGRRHRYHRQWQWQQQQHRKENVEPEHSQTRRPPGEPSHLTAAAAAYAARRYRDTSGGSSPRKRPGCRGRSRVRPKRDTGDAEGGDTRWAEARGIGDDDESDSDTERENAATTDADTDGGESPGSGEARGGGGRGASRGGGGGGGGYGGGTMPTWLGAPGRGVRLKGSVDIIPLTANEK